MIISPEKTVQITDKSYVAIKGNKVEYLDQANTPTNKLHGSVYASYQTVELEVWDRRKHGGGINIDMWVHEGVQNTKEGNMRTSSKQSTLPEAVARHLYETLRAYFEE